MAAMMLQIAIMMSSIGALIKRPAMLVVRLGIGNVGLVYVVNGIFTFF